MSQEVPSLDRLTALRAALEEEHLDALLVSSASNRRYLSGFTGSFGYLLIGSETAVLATDFRYYEQSASQAPAFRLHEAVGGLERWLPELFKEVGGKRVGFEAADLSYALYRQMVGIVEDCSAGQRPVLTPVTGILERLRARKDTSELAKLQAAIDLGDAAIEHVTRLVEPGWTEKQVAWEIERSIHEHGGDGPSFSTIVAAGPWGAMPHAYPRDHVLQQGDGLIIDMGARLEGYCSDLTRTITVGAPAAETEGRFREIYDVVLAAQLAAYEMIEPGMTGEQAHMLAQSVIDAAGYGEAFGHGLGHGIGLQVHEAPRVTRWSSEVLEEGMVFSIEPGIYISGWGGVRIEDLAVLENGHCRFLSHAPK